MPNNSPSRPSHLDRPGYDPAPVSFLWIIVFGASVLVMGLVTYAGATLLLHSQERKAAQQDRRDVQLQLTPFAAQAQPYFPYPREQPSPIDDLKTYRARATKDLNTYGWIDQKSGIARIPIERAMDLIAQQNTPAQTNAGPSSLQLQRQRPENAATSNDGSGR